MKIAVKVKVNARENLVEQTEEGNYIVWTTAIPAAGKANDKVLELLADYFNIAKSRMRIVHGLTGVSKIIEIS